MQNIDNVQILRQALSLVGNRLPALLAITVVSLITSTLVGISLIGTLILTVPTLLMGTEETNTFLAGAREVAPERLQWIQPENIPESTSTVILIAGIITVIAIIWDIIAYSWFYHVLYRIVRGEAAMTKGVFGHACYAAFTMFMARIIFGVAVSVGSLFFVIPGFIILLSWYLFPFVVINESAGAWNALVRSYHMMMGYRTKLFMLFAVGLLGSAIVQFVSKNLPQVSPNVQFISGSILSIISSAVFLYYAWVLPLCAGLYYEKLRASE